MTSLRIEHAAVGKEIMPSEPGELRAMRIGGKTEMMPSDPRQVAKILKERRSKSPAARLRTKMAADLKKRGIK